MATSRDLAAQFVVKDEMTRELERIRGSLGHLESKFGDVNKSAGNTAGVDSFLGSVGKIAGGIGLATVAMAGFNAAGDLLKKSMIDTNASLETSTLQFKILMGDADKAAEHVKGLFEFAKATPFETGPIIQASRSLEVMGGAALNTKENLKLVGDAAAVANVGIEEVSMWVGRAYAAIQAGRPFGEAAQRLSELALITPDARVKLEELAAVGASSETIWKTFTGELERFNGGMAELEKTWQGLTSTATESVNFLIAGALKPLFEESKKGLEEFNKWAGSDAATKWGEDLSASINNDVLPGLRAVLQAMKDIAAAGHGAGAGIGQGIDAALEGDVGKAIMGFAAAGRRSQQFRDDAAAAVNAADIQSAFAGLQDKFKDAVEDLKLESTISKNLKKDIQAGIETGVDDAVDVVSHISFTDRLMQAFRLGDIANEMGDGGAELMDAFAEGIEHNTDKTANATEQAARKIMDRWLKALDPARAAERGAQLQAALASGLDSEIQAVLRAGQAEVVQQKAAEDADKRAKQAEREAKAAIAEAERVIKEWERTKPITLDLFGGAFGGASAGTALGAGRGLFEGLTKAIEEGGQQNIDALGRMAAEMAERMRQELGPDEAEAWIGGMVDRVNRAITDRTPETISAVGAWVQHFDITNQLRMIGEREADEINKMIDRTREIIDRATKDAETKEAELRASFTEAEAARTKREGMQEDIRLGLDAKREELQIGREGVRLQREMEDIETRRLRQERDRQAQGPLNTFGKNSLQVLAEMKAIEDAAKRVTQQTMDQSEDRAIAQTRRAEDLQGAKDDAAILNEEKRRLSEELVNYENKLRNDSLEETIRKIRAGVFGEGGTIPAANQALADRTTEAQQQSAAAREQAARRAGVDIGSIVVTNSLVVGEGGIEELAMLIKDAFDQETNMLAYAG